MPDNAPSNAPSNAKAIKAAYDDGLLQVQRVLFSTKSTAAQRKLAKQTLKDLTAMLLAQSVKTVEGRTALLAGLIVELNQVIASVRTKPPFEDILVKLTGTLGKVEKLLAEEKKNLI